MTILKAEFKANYKAAEARATAASNGIAFTAQDRITLTNQRKQMGMSISEAALLVAPSTVDYHKHYGRFNLWEVQIRQGMIRVAPEPTGESVGQVRQVAANTVFDGRIKTKADIQPAFNKAALQLVKLGITTPHDAAAYLANGFVYAKSEQKIDIQANRFVTDLRTSELTKDEAKQAFDRAFAQL